MKFPRRRFLHLAAGAAALPMASRMARAEDRPTPPSSEPRERPLAERLAAYAHGLRYDDLDAATIERVKSHVIDTIGCESFRSEEHTSELQSLTNLVCRLLP